MNFDIKDPKHWNSLLAAEWLWDIDETEWFRQVSVRADISKITDKEKFISDLERRYWVLFEVDNELLEVRMLKDWIQIWSIKTRYYSHWNV